MKTCIITGASKGIGRAIAIQMSKKTEISTLILLARSESELQITKELMDQSKNIETYPIDLMETDHVIELINHIGKKI